MSKPLLIARTLDTELFLLRGQVKLSRCKNWRNLCQKSAFRCLWPM